MNEPAKTLIFLGIVLVAAGFFFAFFSKIPGIGKLPGDMTFRRDHFSFYFPLTTCLLASLILTLLFSLLRRK